ncbi:MAG: glycosyltransferase family 39 protein [Bacteriovoracaceae bacterium]
MVNRIRPNHYVIFFIGALFLFNLVQSSTMDLSHDEAYYWVYSQFPAWGYYDHPPMVGWLIWAGTFFGHNELAVRFPFALMQAGVIWLLWGLADKKNFAVFSISILSFPLLLASGFLALPDTPLLFFSVLFWSQALKYYKDEKPKHWLILPLIIACMFYSKYHALVVAILTVAAMPQILKRKSFWFIVLAVVVLYLPHVVWQLERDFISFEFHLTKRSEKRFDLMNILEFIGGQAALGGFLAFLVGMYFVVKKGVAYKTLYLNSIGFFLFTLLLSFRNKVEANWTVTAFAAFVPLLCATIQGKKEKKLFVWCALPAVLLVTGLRLALMPAYKNAEPPFERILEVKNWKEKTREITRLSPLPLYAETYQIASKLSFYGEEFVPALALGSRESQFSLLKLKTKPQKDDKISYVGDKAAAEAQTVEIGYEGPVFVIPEIEFQRLLEMHDRTYEEVIRN